MTTTANHLRQLASKLRTTSMPLADIIPALQRAADELDGPRPAQETPTIAANLRHAARCGHTVVIGGGEFGPAELLQASQLLDRVARYRTMVEAANTESDIIDKLIAMGWTPPPAAAGVFLAQRREAIDHLQAILNSQRTATQAWESERAAREWLLSIGIEPR